MQLSEPIMSLYFRRLYFTFIFMLFGAVAIFSDIVLSDNTFDFGTVQRNKAIQGMFYIISDDFTRVQLQTGCDCLSALYAGQ